jgi:hypothetical protein
MSFGGGRWLMLVEGRVGPRVSRLEAELKGRRLPVPLSGRFFLAEVPGVRDSELPEVTLVGYDAAGREVARYAHGQPRVPVPGPIDVSGRQPLLEIRTRRTRKPIRLYVVTSNGVPCKVLVTPGGTSRGYQVARRDFVAGRRPIELVGRRVDGDIVGETKLGPWAR